MTSEMTDPRRLVRWAASAAGNVFPAARSELHDLATSCPDSVPAGDVLRLERWWDEDPDDGGRLCADVMTLADAIGRVPDEDLAREELTGQGWHDVSDPSQPMGALYVALRPLTEAGR